jgi:hypothetical protein
VPCEESFGTRLRLKIAFVGHCAGHAVFSLDLRHTREQLCVVSLQRNAYPIRIDRR